MLDGGSAVGLGELPIQVESVRVPITQLDIFRRPRGSEGVLGFDGRVRHQRFRRSLGGVGRHSEQVLLALFETSHLEVGVQRFARRRSDLLPLKRVPGMVTNWFFGYFEYFDLIDSSLNVSLASILEDIIEKK